MGYVLVKFDSNWADEMPIDGHLVLTDEEYENFKEAISFVFESLKERKGRTGYYDCVEITVGTNEGLIYENEEEFLQCLSFVEIDNLQRKELRDMNLLSRGFMNNIYGQILDQAEEAKNA